MDDSEAKQLLYRPVTGDHSIIDEKAILMRGHLTGNEGAIPETGCGIDERSRVGVTTVLPYKAVCKLIMRSPSGYNFIGSGWLTHHNKLYTAGHCVFDHRFGGWMESIIVIPAKSGRSEPYGRYYAAALCATRGWVEDESQRYDMAAIKLSASVEHDDYLVPTLADPNYAMVCGYPSDRDNGLFQYTMGAVVSHSKGRFYYMIDTFGGQSGGPVLENRQRAVAIHNYGGCPNSASDLYREFVDAIDAW